MPGSKAVVIATLGAAPQVVTISLDLLLEKDFDTKAIAIFHTANSDSKCI